MKRKDQYALILFAGLAALIWLRDRSWFDAAEDVLPALAALPLFYLLGKPWKPSPHPTGSQTTSPLLIALSVLLFVVGIASNLTLLLAAGWTAGLWCWLKSAVDVSIHARLRRLLVLPFAAFPWINLDLQGLGWWFRLSGAWATNAILSGAGLEVTREGTRMLVQGMPVSVDVSCSGLKVLQSLVIAGTLLAYVLLGRSPRYWWNVALLLPLAWVANTARILTISLASMTFGPEFAMGLFHTWGGLLVLVLMFLMSWGIFKFQVPERSLAPA